MLEEPPSCSLPSDVQRVALAGGGRGARGRGRLLLLAGVGAVVARDCCCGGGCSGGRRHRLLLLVLLVGGRGCCGGGGLLRLGQREEAEEGRVGVQGVLRLGLSLGLSLGLGLERAGGALLLLVHLVLVADGGGDVGGRVALERAQHGPLGVLVEGGRRVGGRRASAVSASVQRRKGEPVEERVLGQARGQVLVLVR